MSEEYTPSYLCYMLYGETGSVNIVADIIRYLIDNIYVTNK